MYYEFLCIYVGFKMLKNFYAILRKVLIYWLNQIKNNNIFIYILHFCKIKKKYI